MKKASNNENSVIEDNESKILKVLKQIFNIKVISLLAAIVAAVAAAIAIWPPTKVERLKEEINKNVLIVEGSFHPDAIIIDSTTSPDVQLIKDFQNSALRLATLWKSIYTMQPLSEYETNDEQQITGIVKSKLATLNDFDKETKIIQSDLEQIVEYGKKNNISQYIISADKLMILYEKSGKRDEVFGNIKNSVQQDFMNMILRNEFKGKNIRKVSKPLDKLYNDKVVLDYVNSLFANIVELNSYYMDYYRNSTR